MMALLAVLVTTTALAGGGIKKMPADLALPQSGDSPGKVTFAHTTHVDESKPDCTVCHPRLFSILKTQSADRRIVHARMEKGAQCGACHNGKTAFKMDDCGNCHR
jgi:c(7)-type cytochrome triheme protein